MTMASIVGKPNLDDQSNALKVGSAISQILVGGRQTHARSSTDSATVIFHLSIVSQEHFESLPPSAGSKIMLRL